MRHVFILFIAGFTLNGMNDQPVSREFTPNTYYIEDTLFKDDQACPFQDGIERRLANFTLNLRELYNRFHKDEKESNEKTITHIPE